MFVNLLPENRYPLESSQKMSAQTQEKTARENKNPKGPPAIPVLAASIHTMHLLLTSAHFLLRDAIWQSRLPSPLRSQFRHPFRDVAEFHPPLTPPPKSINLKDCAPTTSSTGPVPFSHLPISPTSITFPQTSHTPLLPPVSWPLHFCHLQCPGRSIIPLASHCVTREGTKEAKSAPASPIIV